MSLLDNQQFAAEYEEQLRKKALQTLGASLPRHEKTALEITACMPFRVALAKIAGTAAADYSIIAPLPAEHQVRILCRMIDDMREIADKALGTEQMKRDLKDWREAHAKDAPEDRL